MHFRTLFIVSVLSLASGQDRKITPKLNPDCKSCSENTTLVYIRAEGPHDTIYQLWDFTRGTPTVIYAVAGVNSFLTVSWVNDRPVHFNLSEDLQYSFAVAITELIEYNDLVDSGQFNSSGTQRRYPLRELKWTHQKSILTDQEAMLQMHAAGFKNRRQWINGSIEIKLDLLPFRDFSSDLPHLIHTANSSLLDVQLVNLTTSRDYNSSRFALNLLLISTEDPWGTMVQEMKKSLDDEHTPGVFEIIELKTPAVASGAGGYLQFRPVAYTQRERSVTSSTVVHASAFNSSEIPIPSTLYDFYGQFLLDTNLLIQNVAVSFGEPEDGFYRHVNFTAWKVNGIEKVIMPKLNNTENYIQMEMAEREREEMHRLKMVKAKKIRAKALAKLRSTRRDMSGSGEAFDGATNPSHIRSMECLTSLLYTCNSPLSSTTESAGDFKPTCYPPGWDDDDLIF